MLKPDRRLMLAALSASLLPLPARAELLSPAVRLGPAHDFSFAALAARAKKNASQPYKAPPTRAAEILHGIDFDAAQKIRFRPDHGLWPERTYPAAFFHLSRYSAEPVILHALEDGPSGLKAREILYGPDYFDYGAAGLDPKQLVDLGFAGFRILEAKPKVGDWLAFQGASYFRSSGQDAQYGISARGIAINTAAATAEEFPRFSEFWLDQSGPAVSVYALLDGPSITGAYKFDAMKNQNGAVVMNVHCDLFFRAGISRLGVAPLTSMYWYGENERRAAADWRPEIHDSDGLAIWTGKGERIWRPLVNPPQVQTNSFLDNNPKGFGLMQRDRNFADYEDDGAHYNKRPGLWVEPKGNWGAGAVQLVEIPTEDETHDNIVAYWRPDSGRDGGDITSGDSRSFDYRLYWQNNEPAYPKDIAHVVATRRGRGGIPGQNPWPRDKQKFVVDFSGGPLAVLPVRFDIAAVASASRGTIDNAHVLKVVGTDRWRASFDLQLDGNGPVDLRLFLKLDGKTLSETWLYQYFP
ncbi:MAG: glucan biosynthesis protein [Alphaproteobacteria bacterium]|nr:glucan biosynthesis protein [Alphaproteobacteria bacterium]